MDTHLFPGLVINIPYFHMFSGLPAPVSLIFLLLPSSEGATAFRITPSENQTSRRFLGKFKCQQAKTNHIPSGFSLGVELLGLWKRCRCSTVPPNYWCWKKCWRVTSLNHSRYSHLRAFFYPFILLIYEIMSDLWLFPKFFWCQDFVIKLI